MTILHLCLAAGYASGVCHTLLPSDIPPPLPPDWATPQWVHNAAGIVAGETVPHCTECDLWIACTIVGDVTLRGYHPWRLRPAKAGEPGRWHGWREPRERHYEAVKDALEGGCGKIPECAYLGSFSDYTLRWRFGLAKERASRIIGSEHGVIVCIQHLDN